jgi:ABC-type transport system substrate-binding protein
MERILGKASWTTAFAAVFLAFVMLGSPTLGVTDNGNDLGAVDNAAASAGSRTVTLGIVDLKGAIATLNPLLYTMAEEMMVEWPCYSFLLEYDVDGQTRQGDLARSWKMSPNGLFWNFTITPNAVFYDKVRAAASLPMIQLTGRDVIWTFNMIQNVTKNYLHSYFPSVEVGGVKVPIIKHMSLGATLFDFQIELATQYAPFTNALTSIPIFPMYIWDTKVNDDTPPYHGWDWANYGTGIPPLVGSGPWYYDTDGLPSALTVSMKKSPTWFMTEERGWELRVDEMVLLSETSEDSNLNDFKAGNVDVMMWPSSDQYLKVLVGPEYSDVYKAAISSGFVYEYNLNQMTDAMRADLGGKFGNGENSQILQDPIVRKAIGMTVDKTAFINAVRGGLGEPADSLVPKSHPYHYTYGSDPVRDTGLLTFDPQAARTMLRNAGWTYDISGAYVPEWDLETYPLCQYGGSSPLQFRMYTLSESPEWDKGARLLCQWAQEAGVDLWSGYEIKSTNDMNGIWAAADYDMWLWDWVFTPTSEISVDILDVLITEEIGSWQDIYWSNPTFDAMYAQSLTTMDPVSRKILTDEMQRINYEAYACQLLAYRADLYAASPRGPDQWTNWGDWQNNWILTPDQLAPWVFMTMQPKNQIAPKITSATVPSTWSVGSLMSVSASATDTQGVQYRWFWDNEGNKTGWQSTGGASHAFMHDGVYDVYLAVRETSGLDTFTNWTKFKVTVTDSGNTPPHSVDWSYWPSTSINGGTYVYLNVTSAVDDNLDQMYFNWDFDDGHTATGRNVVHQFQDGVAADVTLSVDDMRYGSGTRPVAVSYTIDVAPNTAPSISVPDRSNPNVPPRISTLMWFETSDTDGDPQRYTWNFGDGTPIVVTPTNETSHTYQQQGSYVMQCWADDLTGIPDHNATDTGQVLVRAGNNTAPTIQSTGVSLRSVVRYQTVTFYANATDIVDHDDVIYTFNFGDGTTYTTTAVWNSKTIETTHSYSTTGTKITQLTISDGYLTAQSIPIAITVAMGNREPVITPVANINATVGSTRTFTATAYDPDGAPDNAALTYSWQFYWRNESGVIQHANLNGQTVDFTWNNGSGAAGYLFRVFVNDNNMTSVIGPWNVSDGGYAYVNAIPWFATPPGSVRVQALKSNTYTVDHYAWDNDTLDNTTLVYTWNFGDGTPVQVGAEVTHVFAYAATAVNYTVTVRADDLFVDDLAVSHNVSATAKVEVFPYVLHLYPGWNLVTLPTILNGYKANTLGLLTGDVVVGFNPATGVYDKNFIVNVTPPPLAFPIAASTGYWVFVGVNENLYLYGTIPTAVQSSVITVKSGGGWAIIGFNSLKTTMKASNIKTMFTGGIVTTVAAFDSVNKTYKSYVGIPPTDFYLVPGQAYWVYLTASGTLTYTP